VPDISESHVAGSEIVALLDSVPEVDSESTEGKVIPKVQGRIELKDVHFRYPTRPAVRVLRNFNLTVHPGTHVALVGASGSGKSTIIQLIERFYDPISGAVLVDDENISELNVQEYRKNLSLVSQEPVSTDHSGCFRHVAEINYLQTLYAGTIRLNILLGAIKPLEEVTQEELEAVCRDANILDFINSLPDGFETEVGGKGSQLSGGQKRMYTCHWSFAPPTHVAPQSELPLLVPCSETHPSSCSTRPLPPWTATVNVLSKMRLTEPPRAERRFRLLTGLVRFRNATRSTLSARVALWRVERTMNSYSSVVNSEYTLVVEFSLRAAH